MGTLEMLMGTAYVVRALPLRRTDTGKVLGWIRVDVFAKEGSPYNVFYLRDGSAAREAEALRRIAGDPELLYPTRREAVQAGIKRLRELDAGRAVQPLT